MDGSVVNKVLSDMEVADLAKVDIRRTIDQLQQGASSALLLTIQWKEIEDLMDSSRKSLEERAKELKATEECLKERMDEFSKKEERLLAAEARENQLNAIRDSIPEKLSELEKEEKEFGLRRKAEIEKRKEEIECAEKSMMQLETVQQSVNKKLEELDSREKKFVSVKNSVDESLVKLNSTEQSMQMQRKELESAIKQLKDCVTEFEAKRKMFGDDPRGYKKRLKDLEATYEKKKKGLELKEKMSKERERKIKSKEKEIEERYKDLELRERNLSSNLQNPCVKIEPLVNDLAKKVHLDVPVIGKSLQIYLNENCSNQGSAFVKNQVDNLLNFLSLDPAKLVLDAMEGFHSGESDDNVVQRDCIFLLEQLMKRKPQIQPQVKQEATQLAINWLEKAKVNPENINGVLGFLLLSAVFGLASSFESDVLLSLLERVVQYDQAPQLFQILGCSNKISGVVESLIRKEEYFVAIRFILEFRLVDEIPPGPLLLKYLDVGTATKERAESGNTSNVQKDIWVEKLLDSIIALKYIEEKKLESLFPMQELREKISSLEKQLACEEATVAPQTQMKKPVVSSKERCHGLSSSKNGSANHQVSVAPPSTTTSSRAPTHETASDQQRRVKRQRTSGPTGADKLMQDSDPCNHVQDSSVNPTGSGPIPSRVKTETSSENMSNNRLDGKTSTPKTLPPEKKESNRLQESELLDACRRAPDPAKLLLDSVMALQPSSTEGGYEFKLTVSTNICYFLLVELKKLPYSIKPLVQDEAKKLAMAWNSKLLKTRLDQMEVPCFLQFLVVYNLVPVFTVEELLNLLDNDYWRARAPDLCKSLGLVKEIPNFIQNLIKNGLLLKAVNHIYALDMVDKFAPVPLINEYLKRVDDPAENSCQNAAEAKVASINRQIKKLRDGIKCIKQHKLQSRFPLGTLEERVHMLFVQRSKLNVSKQGEKNKLTSGTSSSLPKDQPNKAKPSSASTSQNIFIPSSAKPATPTSRSSVLETPTGRNTQTTPSRREKKRRRESNYHRHSSQEWQAGVTSKYFNYDPLPRHPVVLTEGHEYNYDQQYRSLWVNPGTGHSDNYWQLPHQGYDSHQHLYNVPFRND